MNRVNRFLTSLYGAWLSEHCSNPVAGRNKMVAVLGFPCPNPIPRSYDTETDSDPDPDLAWPSSFSDDLRPSGWV
ncbi:MAG: hypothetical protein PHF14_13740 [Verrucomicrobiota bacterium]|nr:hypothetical protein [Verrucomicrobiota bacterium]